MSEFKFNCPGCGQHLAATVASAGQQIQCPTCQSNFVIPAAPDESPSSTLPKPPFGLRIVGTDKSKSSGATPHVFCRNCGKPIAEGVAFCGACGKSTGQDSPGAGQRPIPPTLDVSSLPENIAGGLCYVCVPVVSIVFLIIDRRNFVRFHAAQSLIALVGFFVLRLVFGFLFGLIFAPHIRPSFPIPTVPRTIPFAPYQPPDMSWVYWLGYLSYGFWLAGLILWILCMLSAFRGERFHVPIAGDIAENIANKR